MADFSWSWSDSITAVLASCLPCFKPTSLPNADSDSIASTSDRPRRARYDELEGLLAEVDTDNEAETMSLHSNPGSNNQRQRRKKTGLKRITLFGYNLFGKPPIQLPVDEEEGGNEIWRRRRKRRRERTSTDASSSTFDSDAATLDPETINGVVTSSELEQQFAYAAEEQRLKEERRAIRRERKELKRVAKALAQGGDDIDFEGFQNSSVFPQLAQPQVAEDDFGPYVSIQRPEIDEEEADLDGALYTRRAPSSNGGSDSRSRTSGSQSQSNASNSRVVVSPGLITPAEFSATPTPKRKKSKSKSSSNKSSNQSHSSTSAPQSPFIDSPVNAAFPADITSPEVVIASPTSPSFTGQEEMVSNANADQTIDSTSRLTLFPSTGFGGGNSGSPSLGFGRAKGRDLGAFLATRGDEA